MQIPLRSASDVGKIVRATRKAQGLRQDDTAGSIGLSENFLGKVEKGNESVQWGKLFQAMKGLGIRVYLDVPDGIALQINEQNQKNKPCLSGCHTQPLDMVGRDLAA